MVDHTSLLTLFSRAVAFTLHPDVQVCMSCTGCTAQKPCGQLCGIKRPSVVCSVSLWHAALSTPSTLCSAMEDVPTTLEMHQKG